MMSVNLQIALVASRRASGTLAGLEARTGEGRGGRFVVDLASLGQAELELSNDRFFIRSFAPAGVDMDAAWSVTTGGLVASEVVLSADASDQGLMLVECSGNTNYGGFGLMSGCVWGGGRLSDLLDRVRPTIDAR